MNDNTTSARQQTAQHDPAPRPGDPGPGDWLTTAQVAALHGVQGPTVAKWCRLGHLQGRKWGRDWQVLAADAHAFTPPDPGGGWPKGKPRNVD